MKTSVVVSATLLAMAVTGSLALAQDNVTTTSTPAPSQAANVAVTPDHVIYLGVLPTPDELIRSAKNHGTPIKSIDVSADKVTVQYLYAGGRPVTFVYTLLPAGTAADPAAPVAAVPATPGVVYATQSPARPTVVYAQPENVVYAQPETVVYYPNYYPRYAAYDPAWDFWGPLSIGIGLGWISGGHGGWHGGGHGGWHGGGHGGGHTGVHH